MQNRQEPESPRKMFQDQSEDHSPSRGLADLPTRPKGCDISINGDELTSSRSLMRQENSMARKPNYSLERKERERIKAEKAEFRAVGKAEKATHAATDEPTSDKPIHSSRRP